tara:strand:+ start:252 stop:374 length:123 start_codon:yes stop_codon:yes gene_type:complete
MDINTKLNEDILDAVFIPEHIYEKMCMILECDNITTMGFS